MAISAKQIIKKLKENKKSILKKDFFAFFEQKQKSKKAKSKDKVKHKKRVSGEKKDFFRIEEILSIFEKAGFISIKQNRIKTTNGFFLEGSLNINNYGKGFLKISQKINVEVKSFNQNGALPGDRVRVEIFDYKDDSFLGKVVGVVSRDEKFFLAQLYKTYRGVHYFKILDFNNSMEAFVYVDKNKKINIGDFAKIQLQKEAVKNRYKCKILKIIKQDNDNLDFERIVAKHNLPKKYEKLKKFSPPHFDIVSREDFRNYFTVTIDGDDSKDFDDAISLRMDGENYLLYVHIADVSEFIKKNSSLDKEALKRGNSYYLGNQVISMLPEELSNGLCSLKAGEDRLTLTCKMKISPKGDVLEYKFYKSVIRVNKRLTYKIAEDIIKSKSIGKQARALKKMYKLSKILKEKRLAEGRIDLNIPDYKMVYENRKVKSIEFLQRLESHKLIEEFMLTANEAAAKFLKNNKIPSLYRVHESIGEEKMAALEKFMGLLQVNFKNGKNLGKILQKILTKYNDNEKEQVINLVILKSMMQAAYSPEPIGHFALGFEDYTHFTSPIRRYADLVVHRTIKDFMLNKKFTYKTTELRYIAQQISDLERVAQKAERDLYKLKACKLMQDRIGEKFSGIVSGVIKSGIFVSLLDIPIEGMVPLKNLTDDYYLVQEDDFSVVGKKYGRRFTVGDKINIILDVVDPILLRIDFIIA